MINKFYYKNKKNKKELEIFYREDTTDIKAIQEVIVRNEYKKEKIDFTFEENENWLDIGGHIGTFTKILNSIYNCNVETYEPDFNNYEILKMNTEKQQGIKINNYALTTSNKEYLEFYKPTKENDKYRYTEIKNSRPHSLLKNKHIENVMNVNYDGCKMDIEGTEMSFIDAGYIPKSEKLCFEYHITKDRKIKNLFNRIKILEDFYHEVYYPNRLKKMNENDQYKFGMDFKIHCIKRK
jgi:FkbM family methyltransferase